MNAAGKRNRLALAALVLVLVLAAGTVAYAGFGSRAAERSLDCDSQPVLTDEQREQLQQIREPLRAQLAEARDERDREEMSRIREQMWQAARDILTDEQLAQIEQRRSCDDLQTQQRRGRNGKYGGW